MANIECEDHLGNKFETKRAMCAFHHITEDAYNYRIKIGWTQEEALTIPLGEGRDEKHKKHVWIDHEGTRWNSTRSMCMHWGVSVNPFLNRIKKGWSIEKALTYKNYVVDHLGNKFRSDFQKCKHWGINPVTYRERIQRGWSEKDALETSANEELWCTDHLGNKFRSKEAKVRHWKISISCYNKRIQNGWSEKDALETPVRKTNNKVVYNGKEYNTEKELCEDIGFDYVLFKRRKKSGMTLDEIIDTPTKDKKGYVDGINGEKFFNLSSALDNYEVNSTLYFIRKNAGCDAEECFRGKARKFDKEIEAKACLLGNRELFDLSHTKERIKTKNGEYEAYRCKLCGKIMKVASIKNLEETINRTNANFNWCQNVKCVGRLSSIKHDNNPDISVPKIVYAYTKRKSGDAVYKFSCLDCEKEMLMTFEQIVEHKLGHLDSINII